VVDLGEAASKRNRGPWPVRRQCVRGRMKIAIGGIIIIGLILLFINSMDRACWSIAAGDSGPGGRFTLMLDPSQRRRA